MSNIIYLKIPNICPVCGHSVSIEVSDSGVENLVCNNPQCEGKLINVLEHFCGKGGLDIKGLSKATLEKLLNWGWITCKKDLFELNKYESEWRAKPGFGVKSVENILTAIEQSKNCSLHNFITALGIPLIGSNVSKELESNFNTWDSFIKAVNDKNYSFESIYGFGYEMNKSIKDFDYTEACEIADKYITFNEVIKENTNTANNNIKDKTFVITGKLQKFKNRDEIADKIKSCGGKVVSSISTKTDFLINNDILSTSAKNKAAQKLNIPIISEEKFLEILGE